MRKDFNKEEFPVAYAIKILIDEISLKIHDKKYISFSETYVLTYLECILQDNVNNDLLERINNLIDSY